MVRIDIRRHAERAAPGATAALSAAGFAIASRLGSAGPRYSLVLSSPRDRARETATLIGGRVDEVDPLLDLARDEVLTQEQYDTMRTQTSVSELLDSNAASHAFAEEQLAIWERAARELADGEAALVITHGGNVELPAVLLARRLGTSVDPIPLSYCEGVSVDYASGRAIALRRLGGN